MGRISRVIAVGVASALVITAIGAAAPVAAARGPALMVVNGKPGTKVDICINGKEVKSRVNYGGRASRLLVPIAIAASME